MGHVHFELGEQLHQKLRMYVLTKRTTIPKAVSDAIEKMCDEAGIKL